MYSKGFESIDMVSVPRSRSTSMSSDCQLQRISPLSPPPTTPKPGFIASSAASQIITTDQEFNTADFVADGDTGLTASALVTPAALDSLNGFLDHLLFNILGAAKSTRLACIRPAIADVLKPRLAREVVAAADDELSDYLGGAEEEQFEFRGGQEPDGEFDLVRSWKLTRLRCMVYTRLGDMEEDDEDEYVAQEGLDDGAPRRFTSHVGNITPAAAIFLTSIIEFIGEQALIIAGETARSRLVSNVSDRDEVTESGAERNSMNRLVVEDLDMEKLALNATLGRLWRTWRKCVRTQALGRAVSRESFRRPGSVQPVPGSRKSSVITADEMAAHSVSVPATEEEVDPASIPLPTTEHDVKEIEVPGLSADRNGEIQTLEAVVAHKVRPRSLMVFSNPSPKSPSSTASSPLVPSNQHSPKANRHTRSRSLPNASYFPELPWGEEQTAAPATGEISPTASEEGKRLETMYENDEQSDPTETKPGLAISSDQKVDEEPEGESKEKDVGSLLGKEKHPSAERASLSAASMEVLTSQPSSVRHSMVSMGDRQQIAEVIEGQGMCENPEQVAQKSSKDQALATESVSKDETPTRKDPGAESASSHDASTAFDAPASATPPLVLTSKSSKDESLPSRTLKEPANNQEKDSPPSTSTSGDVESPEGSQNKSKPSPLNLSSGSTHSYARSGLPSSSGVERASVQRVTGRPSTSASSNPRRSDSFTSAREKRPVTAGSSTSQVSTRLKGLIGRQDSASARFRSSSETSRGSDGSGGDSDNLEKLIRSDETLHFTLTPKSVRETDSESPKRQTASRSGSAGRSESVKSPVPPRSASHTHGGSNASSRRTVDFSAISKSRSAETSKSRPGERMSLPPKQRTVQARDARTGNESLRDFADFIKSTGPPMPASPKLTNPGSRSPSVEAHNTRPASSLSRNSGSIRSGPKLEARPAAGAKGNPTSDLIDFIREGPRTPEAHRIPRVVAPFRDTTDSEDPESSGPERTEREIPTRGSLGSTQGSSVAKSYTSFGSRTALLESTNRNTMQAASNTKVPAPARNAQEDPIPARKQRRVPDPYAIDSDDDEDDDVVPSKPKRQEESLMDFLASVPPPESQPAPQPFHISKNYLPPKSPLRQHPPNHPAGQSNYSAKVGMERNGGTRAPPVVSGRQTETSALADFLKNTGPPEPPAPRPSAAGRMKESGVNSLTRLFARRKKVEA